MFSMLPDMRPIGKPANLPASPLTMPCKMFLTRRHEGNAPLMSVVALCDILFVSVKIRVNSMIGVSNV